MPHDPVENRKAAQTRWSRLVTAEERAAATAAARAAMQKRFEDQVDPDRVLDPAVRAELVAVTKRAHYSQMSAKGRATQARRRAEAEQRQNEGTGPETGSGPADTERIPDEDQD